MIVRKCDYCLAEMDGRYVRVHLTKQGVFFISLELSASGTPVTANLDLCADCSQERVDHLSRVFLRGMSETDPAEAACER